MPSIFAVLPVSLRMSLRMSPRSFWLVAVLTLLAGCGGVPVKQKAEDLVQGVMVKTRSKGEKQLANTATVSQELACGRSGAAAARMESSTVLPERPKAGRELAHRVVLAACPLAPEWMTGTLTRRVTQQGRTLFEDSEPFTLKPGRWAIDVFVGIPAQAQPGPYRLDVRFTRRGLRLESTSDFAVAAP